jgi:hypothetical protein
VRSALVLLSIAACGRVGFDGSTDAMTADADPGCTVETFDTFPTGYSEYGVGTITAEGGTIRIDFPGADQTESGLAISARSLRDATISLHVVATDSRVETAFGVHGTSGGSIHFDMHDRLRMMVQTPPSGPEYPVDIAIDPSQMWWQFRAVGDRIYAETSADGAAWMPLFDVVAPFSLDSAFFDFGVGAYGGAIGPIVARFDQLVRCEI